MDETGLSWAFLDEAPDPSVIVPSHHVVLGSGAAVAVAVVVDITDDSVVHVQPTLGPVVRGCGVGEDGVVAGDESGRVGRLTDERPREARLIQRAQVDSQINVRLAR